MTTINSVTGPIDSADLGFTLMHEHVLVAAMASPTAIQSCWDPTTNSEPLNV